MGYQGRLVTVWEPSLQQSTSGLFIFLIQRPKQERTCKSKANKTPTGGKKGKKESDTGWKRVSGPKLTRKLIGRTCFPKPRVEFVLSPLCDDPQRATRWPEIMVMPLGEWGCWSGDGGGEREGGGQQGSRADARAIKGTRGMWRMRSICQTTPGVTILLLRYTVQPWRRLVQIRRGFDTDHLGRLLFPQLSRLL